MSENFEQIPKDLIRAFLTNRMCLFIGAGISQNLGMPNWSGLAKKIIDLCRKYELIIFLEQETLLKMYNDPIITISYCHDLILKSASKVIKEDYNALLIDIFYKKKAFDKYSKKDSNNLKQGIELYKLIIELAQNALIVTTNYDNVIPINDKKRKEYDSCNFKQVMDEKSIIYLHGRIDEKEQENYNKLILTRKHYDNLYLNNPQNHRDCLNEIFKNKYILFLGYSLGDFEILQSLSMVNNDNDEEALKSYFLLVDYRDHEKESFKIKQKYYRDNYNIETFVYNVSINGYEELFKKLKLIKENIPNEIDCFSYMDKYLKYKNLETIHDKVLFQDLMEKEQFNNYFIQNMNDINYFKYLNKKGFFSYDTKNFYKKMYLLEKLLPQILEISLQEDQDKYFNEYICIIKDNLNKPISIDDYSSLNNIWALVSKIPFKYYDIELINLLSENTLKHWLNNDFIKRLILENNVQADVIKKIINLSFSYEIKKEKNCDSHKNIIFNYKNVFYKIKPLDIARLIKTDYDFLNKIFQLILKLDRGKDWSLQRDKKTIKDSKYNEDYYENKFEIFILNILRECLLLDDNCFSYIEKFLYSKYRILNRLAIYIIHKKWINIKFQNLFYVFFEKLRHKKNSFFIDQLYCIKIELNDLLVDNAQEIIDSKQFKLDKILDKLFNAEEENYKKQSLCEFLQPFKNIEPYKSKYLALKKELGYEPKVEPFVSSAKGGWVSNKSPVKDDDFKKLTLEEQAVLLSIPIEEKREYFEDYVIAISEKGLARQFESIIIENPVEYIANLDNFIEVPIVHKLAILDALIKIVDKEENQNLDWEKVLLFIEKLNKTIELKEEEGLLIQELSFIKALLEHKQDSLLYDRVIMLLTPILEYDLFEQVSLKKALESSFIKCIRGVRAEVLFLLAQSMHNLNDSIIKLISEQFKKENNLKFYEAFGAYLSNLYYRFKKNNKKEFLLELLNNLKVKSFEQQILFFEGYFTYANIYVEDFFNIFENNSIFQNLLNNELLDDEIKKRFVDFAIYIAFFENKNDLLNKIIKSNNSEHLTMMVNIFCVREDLMPYKDKILKIWNELTVYEKSKIKLTDNDKKLLEETFDLLVYLNDDDLNNKDILNKLFISLEYQSDHLFMFTHIREKIKNSPAILNKVLYEYIEIIDSIYASSVEDEVVVEMIKEIYEWNQKEAIKLAEFCIFKKNALSKVLEWRRSLL